MNILAIARGHNGSTTLLVDGKVVFYLEEERLSRFKYDGSPLLGIAKAFEYVDHIDHLVRIAGINHVGIGSDYDGVSKLPVGLEDVSTYPRITQLLLDRGYCRRDIDKIMSANMMRVIRQVERVSQSQNN